MKQRMNQGAVIPTEAQEHEAVVLYLANKYPKARVHHSPNEGKRGYHAQRAIRTHGTSKGFPDILVYDWRSPRILHIEMKRQKGSNVSAEQKEWLQWLRETGHTSVLARGYDEAVQAIEQFFS